MNNEKDNIVNTFDVTAGPKERIKWLKDQIKERNVPSDLDNEQFVKIFPESCTAVDNEAIKKMMTFIGEDLFGVADNYSKILMNNVEFREMAKLSSNGPYSNWFENVIRGKKEPEITTLCQKINLRLVSFLLAKAGEHKRDGENKLAASIIISLRS